RRARRLPAHVLVPPRARRPDGADSEHSRADDALGDRAARGRGPASPRAATRDGFRPGPVPRRRQPRPGVALPRERALPQGPRVTFGPLTARRECGRLSLRGPRRARRPASLASQAVAGVSVGISGPFGHTTDPARFVAASSDGSGPGPFVPRRFTKV